MKMKHLVFMLMIVAMTTTAQAAGDKSSLFTCGVNLGGKQLSYTVGSDTNSKARYRLNQVRMNHVLGAVRAEPVQLNLPQLTNTSKPEVRLPRKLTFATIGCSWR
jgi:hypothetical protein